MIEQMKAESAALFPHVWKAVLRELTLASAGHLSPAVAAPTLVVWGDRDTLTDAADQAALRRGLRNARALTYPGLGHMPHWQKSREIGAAIASFLAERGGGEPSAGTAGQVGAETGGERVMREQACLAAIAAGLMLGAAPATGPPPPMAELPQALQLDAVMLSACPRPARPRADAAPAHPARGAAARRRRHRRRADPDDADH